MTKFDKLIEEITRRGMLKGLVGMSVPSTTQGQSNHAEYNFIKRVELLVSYLESGIKPNEKVAQQRNYINIAAASRRNFRGSYHIALGGKNMGENIFNKPYWELDKLFKGAKGKYQIIPTTFKDLENNGLYNEVPSAKTDFSPTTQDRIFMFMKDQKYNFKSAIREYMSGNLDKAIWFLSREWASIPKDSSNLSYYDGDGRNKALIDYQIVKRFLKGDIGISDIKK